MHSAIQTLSLSDHFKQALFVLAVACCLLLPAAPAKAASLTEPQIQAISGVLRAFEVDRATVVEVEDILHASVSGTVLGVATTTQEHSDFLPPPAKEVRYSPADIEQFRASGLSKECSSGLLTVYVSQGKTLMVRSNGKSVSSSMLLDSTGLYSWSSSTTTVYKSPFSTSTFAGTQKMLTCVDAAPAASLFLLPANAVVIDVVVRTTGKDFQPKQKIVPTAPFKPTPKEETKKLKTETRLSCKIKATPSKIVFGQSTTLSWSSEGATGAAWIQDSKGKDNIAPPSGIPGTSGSISFAPLISETVGSTNIPWVTLLVFGPSGTSTCSAYITISSSVQAAFDKNTFIKPPTLTPTISGTAIGTTQVQVLLKTQDYTTVVYSSGLLPVVGGKWSTTVPSPLPPGSYMIYVNDASGNNLTNGGYLKVATSTTSSAPFNYLAAYSDSFNENLAAVANIIVAVPVVEAPVALLTNTLTDLLVYAGIGQ